MELYILESGGFSPPPEPWGISASASADLQVQRLLRCGNRGYHWCTAPGDATTHTQDMTGDQGAQCPLPEAGTAVVTSLTLHGYNW